MQLFEADIRRNWGWHDGQADRQRGTRAQWAKPGQGSGHPCDKSYGEGYWAGFYNLPSPSKYDPMTGKKVR